MSTRQELLNTVLSRIGEKYGADAAKIVYRYENNSFLSINTAIYHIEIRKRNDVCIYKMLREDYYTFKLRDSLCIGIMYYNSKDTIMVYPDRDLSLILEALH